MNYEQSKQGVQDARAMLNVGEGSKKEVDAAHKRNQSLKSEIEQIKQNVDVQKRTIELLKSKHQKAHEQFKSIATDHHRNELDPVHKQFSEALKIAESCIESLNSHRQQINEDGLQERGFFNGLTRDSEILINKNRLNGMIGKDFYRAAHFTNTNED